jgi:hypothetical protein
MKQLKFYNEFRNHNRKIIREQIKEIKKSGFTPEVDLLFKEQCDLFISGGITIYQFDSYLEKEDWTGSRFHECPYDNTVNIFDKNQFIESILK